MKFSLSTNWCNRRIESGEEIADLALSLGFDELELGFHTTASQAEGFRRRLDSIPVGSVHAFVPVPISAPEGYPELYSLASSDAEARRLASLHVKRNIEFASGIGARSVVLHAGRVEFSSVFSRLDSSVLRGKLSRSGDDVRSRAYMKTLSLAYCRRRRRGLMMLDVFSRELDALLPDLERCGVTLGLENLPYLEGFPDETETSALLSRFKGAPVKAWFDTGHDRVRYMHAWTNPVPVRAGFEAADFIGMHLNDVEDFRDDHLPPSFGKVDFAALTPLARAVRHVVFEPSGRESEERLVKSLAFIRKLWRGDG